MPLTRNTLAILMIPILVLSGCSSVTLKEVDQDWVTANCDLSVWVDDKDNSCLDLPHCSELPNQKVQCQSDEDTYIGYCLNGKKHGEGETFKQNDDGSSFKGVYNYGSSYCGIWSDGDAYTVFDRGIAIKRGSASRDKRNKILGVVAIVAAGAYLASQSGGGGGGYSPTDSDWDWDYQPSNGQWVCRGIQTGQYSQLSNCAYDLKDDDRWPN